MRGASVLPWRLEGNHVVHPDGTHSAVIATDALDVEALGAARRATVVAQFARLCTALDAPLQLVVRVRPAATRLAAPGQRFPALDDAMTTHLRQRLVETHPHDRTIVIAVRAPAPGLAARVERVLTATRAMGVGGAVVGADGLAALGLRAPAGHTPPRWEAHARHAIIGDTWMRGFALRRLPGHAVSAGWLRPVLTLDIDCDIALHLAPVQLGHALHTLGRRLRDMSAHRLLEVERGALADVHVDAGLDAALSLRGRLARHTARPVDLSLTVVVRARTRAELTSSSDAVREAFRASLALCEATDFRHIAAHVTSLPAAHDALHATKLVGSDAAATCLPWTHATCEDAGGYRVGIALATRLPVRIDPFDTAAHGNANIGVFAASGHGKSYAIGALLLEAAARGTAITVIDPEGEHEHVVRSLGGVCCSIAPGGATSLNVFDASDDAGDASAAVTELVAMMCGGALTDVQRAHVAAAARSAQQRATAEQRVALLEDCIGPLRHVAGDVAAVVERYCTAGLGALFNRPSSLRLDGDVRAVSLVDTPAEHMPVCTLLLARRLWSLIRHDRRRRHIVFDEVGALCAEPSLRSLLVQLARRCRKYNASLVVATQNSQDLLSTDEGSVVATNCAVLLLGGHRPAETHRMEAAFGLTPEQRHFLESAARGEFLLVAGHRRLGLRIDLPPLHHSLLAPRQDR